jgi:hypothetical protein
VTSSIGPSKAETFLEEEEEEEEDDEVYHSSFCTHIKSRPGHISAII